MYQKDFDSSDDIQRWWHCCAEVEQNADSSAELWTKSSRDHEIWSTTCDDAIRGNCTHWDCSNENLSQLTPTRQIINMATAVQVNVIVGQIQKITTAKYLYPNRVLEI